MHRCCSASACSLPCYTRCSPLLPLCLPADVEPQEFQALLADPDRKLEGVELAKGLQQLLSSYSGLIEGGQDRQLFMI